MAFYYVKSGGTATGDAGRSATARTGSFAGMAASAYYNSVYDVFGGAVPTTAPDGDNIIVSNFHSESAANVKLGVVSASNYSLNLIVSVDDSDVSVCLNGASVTATTGKIEIGANSNFKSNYLFKGFTFTVVTSFEPDNPYSIAAFDECDINGGTTATVNLALVNANNCNITCKLLGPSTGLKMKGGSLTVSWAYGFTSTSDSVALLGVDLSSGNASKIRYDSTVKMINCKLPSFPPSKYTAFRVGDFVEFIGCDTDDKYYSYAAHSYCGEIFSSEVVYLNYKYDSVNSLSIAINSISTASAGGTLKHKLCEIPAQDLSTTDKTYRVNLLLDTGTAATLSDSEFWVEVSHGDNTDLALGKLVSSRNADILSSGTELTASAETWGGTLPVGNKAYQVDITLSSASLPNVTNTNVVVYVNLAVPDTDVYVCPAVQIGA